MQLKNHLNFLGAMEGTRTPGLLIRRNQTASFIHIHNSRRIVIFIDAP